MTGHLRTAVPTHTQTLPGVPVLSFQTVASSYTRILPRRPSTGEQGALWQACSTPKDRGLGVKEPLSEVSAQYAKSRWNTRFVGRGFYSFHVDMFPMKRASMNLSRSRTPTTVPRAMHPWALTQTEAATSLTWVWECNRLVRHTTLMFTIGKLSNMVRSVAQNDSQSQRSMQNTPTPWDYQNQDRTSHSRSTDQGFNNRDSSREPSHRDSRITQRERIEKLGIGQHQHQHQPQQQQQQQQQHHTRNESGGASSTDFADSHHGTGRRHDYDVQMMETDLSSPHSVPTKNPIPPPLVTVRSEFPTLCRSRQQQSLTCLVTIEVPEGKWHPDPDDLRGAPTAPPLPNEDTYSSVKSPTAPSHSRNLSYESPEVLDEITEELKARCVNWHGLEFQRFGKLRLHGTLRVGKDGRSWQELECYLFSEMLICVKEKKGEPPKYVDGDSKRKMTRCTLKGSIIIKRHLKQVESSPSEPMLTLNLSVNELPYFHLQFRDRNQLELWKHAFLDLDNPDPPTRGPAEYDHDTSGTDEDDYNRNSRPPKRVSSVNSSYGGVKSNNTAPTEYTATDYTPSVRGATDSRVPVSLHVPLDIVVVIPVSSSMQGLKITLLRDTLRFLVQNLGERDRMGLVSFGSSGGGVPLVAMTTKTWGGWNKIFHSIRPVGQKSLRADVVEGANVAMDLLMQRKSANPISTILLISDSSTSDGEGADFVIQRAEAAKLVI